MAIWCFNTRQPATAWLQLSVLEREEFQKTAIELAEKQRAAIKRR